MAVEVGPGTFIEPEVSGASLPQRSLIRLEFAVERPRSAPQLVHVHKIEDPRRVQQFWQSFAIAGGERSFIVFRLDGGKARIHFFELG